jgi:uncharacterized SAM-binding protein YcdF (DUF218 family)
VGRSRRRFWLPFLILLALIATGPFLWLPAIAKALIRDEGPAKAEVAVVLAGDWNGKRVLFAGDLVRQGYVPAVLVSGPLYYGMHESEAAIQYAARNGYPAEWFIGLPNDSLSTRDESRVVLEELKRRGIRRFLLVTSDYHTGRAGRIFRKAMDKMGGGFEMRVVAAPDRWFQPDRWWKSREGMKIVFMEWSKTIATAVGA